jgi:hypothetical protein
MLPVLSALTSEDLLDRSQWWVIGLLVALLLLAWAAYRLRAWFGEDEDHADANRELLAQLQQLKADGDVSEEEFRNIKGRLHPGATPSTPPSKDSAGNPT